ncbi:MAG TPA: hypothetical protein VK961_02660, partial [Chthoniobacter sp.]|nr:hypothetical protein [Chthoniobacter sp.]
VIFPNLKFESGLHLECLSHNRGSRQNYWKPSKRLKTEHIQEKSTSRLIQLPVVECVMRRLA